jgi:hypothetical protein
MARRTRWRCRTCAGSTGGTHSAAAGHAPQKHPCSKNLALADRQRDVEAAERAPSPQRAHEAAEGGHRAAAVEAAVAAEERH